MAIRDIVARARTKRRFYESKRIPIADLKDLVDLARLSPSGGNMQPLKYMIVNDVKRRGVVFDCLAWAGYLKDWKCPEEGERPAAYIVILGDTAIGKSFDTDAGIAVQSMMLGAAESGLGACIFGSIRHEKLRKALAIDKQYEILLVLALGKPKETVVLERVKNDDIKYWRDENAVHHVPKRPLKDILL